MYSFVTGLVQVPKRPWRRKGRKVRKVVYSLDKAVFTIAEIVKTSRASVACKGYPSVSTQEV